jgi:hypothetical protein
MVSINFNDFRKDFAEAMKPLEEKYGIEIVISADLSIKNINDYRIEKSRVAKARPERVAATAAYAAAEPVNDEDYDDAEAVEDDTGDEGENDEDDNRSSERYSRSGGHNNNRRRGRYNNRRGSGRYSRRDNAEEEGRSESVDAGSADNPAGEETKKRAWWKKLLG